MEPVDLTSLISTIVTSVSALVAIIGGLLVSRVISLANDKHFIQWQVDELQLNIDHKKRILADIEFFLLEDDLDDFITIETCY